MQFETDSPTFDEIRKLRKPRTKTVWLPLHPDIGEQIAELDRQVRVEKMRDEKENRTPVAPQLQRELDDLKLQAEESAVAWTFRELPRRQFRQLIEDAPSDDPERRWDDDKLAPPLLAAAAVSPELTVDQAREIWDEWGTWAAYALFSAAYEVQETPSRVPFGAKKSGGTGS